MAEINQARCEATLWPGASAVTPGPLLMQLMEPKSSGGGPKKSGQVAHQLTIIDRVRRSSSQEGEDYVSEWKCGSRLGSGGIQRIFAGPRRNSWPLPATRSHSQKLHAADRSLPNPLAAPWLV